MGECDARVYDQLRIDGGLRFDINKNAGGFFISKQKVSIDYSDFDQSTFTFKKGSDGKYSMEEVECSGGPSS